MEIKRNLDFFNGCLATIAEVNNETNLQYDFELIRLERCNFSLEDQIANEFSKVCEAYSLEKIRSPKEYIAEMLTKFLEKEIREFNKLRWSEEFTDSLLAMLGANEAYRVKMIKTKGFYACRSSDTIFISDQYLYHLHLSVSD